MTYDNFVKIFRLSKFYKQVNAEIACDKSITLTTEDGKKISILYNISAGAVTIRSSDVGLSSCPFKKISFHADLSNGIYAVNVPLDSLDSKLDAAKLIKWAVVDCLINGERTKISFWKKILNFLKFWDKNRL